LETDKDKDLPIIDAEGTITLYSLTTLSPHPPFTILGKEDIPLFTILTVIINQEEREVFALCRGTGEEGYCIAYYNIDTEYRQRTSLLTLCPRMMHGTSICFNYSKRILFLGGVEGYGNGYESMVPAVYALSCQGNDIGYLDQIEIGGIESTQGVHTIKAHYKADIVLATYGSQIVMASLENKKFQKYRIIDKYSDSTIYQSIFNGKNTYWGYCSKNETMNILKLGEGQGPLEPQDPQSSISIQRYTYSIPSFKDDIKFILVDPDVSAMFVFRQDIAKCMINAHTLVLDEYTAPYSSIWSKDRLLSGEVDRQRDANIGIGEQVQ